MPSIRQGKKTSASAKVQSWNFANILRSLGDASQNKRTYGGKFKFIYANITTLFGDVRSSVTCSDQTSVRMQFRIRDRFTIIYIILIVQVWMNNMYIPLPQMLFWGDLTALSLSFSCYFPNYLMMASKACHPRCVVSWRSVAVPFIRLVGSRRTELHSCHHKHHLLIIVRVVVSVKTIVKTMFAKRVMALTSISRHLSDKAQAWRFASHKSRGAKHLRSAGWWGKKDRDGFIHRSWYLPLWLNYALMRKDEESRVCWWLLSWKTSDWDLPDFLGINTMVLTW